MKSGVWASTGSVAMAAASSACCWLPLVVVGLGLGAGGAAGMLERYRWVFLVVATVLLGVAFYFQYRHQERCAPDGACPPRRPVLGATNRVVLWTSTVLVAVFALFPEIVNSVSPGAGSITVAPLADSSTVVRTHATPVSTGRLVRLSADAHELPETFNRDVGAVRLVALLSPT